MIVFPYLPSGHISASCIVDSIYIGREKDSEALPGFVSMAAYAINFNFGSVTYSSHILIKLNWSSANVSNICGQLHWIATCMTRNKKGGEKHREQKLEISRIQDISQVGCEFCEGLSARY